MMEIILRGYKACGGTAEGEALVCRKPFMFLSYVDFENGIVHARGHELVGESVGGKIMVYPCGFGSTAEEPSLYVLKKAGVAPKAVITGSASYQPGVIGAIIADIPMVYGFDRNALGIIQTGDYVRVDADMGIVAVTKKEEA